MHSLLEIGMSENDHFVVARLGHDCKQGLEIPWMISDSGTVTWRGLMATQGYPPPKKHATDVGTAPEPFSLPAVWDAPQCRDRVRFRSIT